MMMILFDPFFLIPLLLTLAVGGVATFIVKSTFNKYRQVGSRRGYTGAQAAAEMLRREGVSGVSIQRTPGTLSDHYDPRTRALRLSEAVHDSRSLAAIGIACHEAGHAVQHARAFAPLHLRSALVPITNICSQLYVLPIIAGIFMQVPFLVMVGVAMCAVALLFAVVTLPVEWDASRRAKLAMARGGLLDDRELQGASAVLNAAFLTYVAAVVNALIMLLYWLLRSGLLGGRR